MKRLFITGNGFDVAHGLPTKYSDFMDFLRLHRKNRHFFRVS